MSLSSKDKFTFCRYQVIETSNVTLLPDGETAVRWSVMLSWNSKSAAALVLPTRWSHCMHATI
ncbi:hypothetical protein [Mycobacterium leprae]|uniref:hypothetical protein n=1 Tax=Mycobacterium leprae TaxID=1769 RepID=UPI003B8A5FF7